VKNCLEMAIISDVEFPARVVGDPPAPQWGVHPATNFLFPKRAK
jgi:hypothetical protein